MTTKADKEKTADDEKTTDDAPDEPTTAAPASAIGEQTHEQRIEGLRLMGLPSADLAADVLEDVGDVPDDELAAAIDERVGEAA